MSNPGSPLTPPNPYLTPKPLQTQATYGSDALRQVTDQMEVDRFHQASPIPALRPSEDVAPPVSPDPASQDQGSVMDKVGAGIAGATVGVVRAPAQAVGGLLDFGNDVGRFIGSSIVPFVQRHPTLAQGFVNATNAWNNSSVGQAYNNVFGAQDGHTRFADQLSARDSLGQVGSPGWNQGAAEMGSIAVGYGAVAKVARASRLAAAFADSTEALSPAVQTATKLAAHAAGLGATAGVILDPEQERLSNVLQNAGVHTEFTDWLAAHGDPNQPADVLEDRFRTAVENAGLGAATDGVFQTGKYWYKALIGDTRAANAIKASIQQALKSRATAITGDPAFSPLSPDETVVSDNAYNRIYRTGQFPADTSAPGQDFGDTLAEVAAQQHLNDAFAGVRSQEMLNGLRQDIATANAPPDMGIEADANGNPAPQNTKFPISRAIRGSTFPDARIPVEADPTGAADGVTQTVSDQAGGGGPVSSTLDTAARGPGVNAAGVTKGRFGAAIARPSPAIPESAISAGARRARLGIAKDANAALTRAGAPETLDPESMHIQADGRITVSADAKAAADAAGLGRPFVSSAETPLPEDTLIHAGAKPYAAPYAPEADTLAEGDAGGAPAGEGGQPLRADGAGPEAAGPGGRAGGDNAGGASPGAGGGTGAAEGALDTGLNKLGSMLKDTGGSLRLRVFGATPRESVQAFADDANKWKQTVKASGDRSADISWDQTPRSASKVGEWRIGNLGSAKDMPGLMRSFAERVSQTARPKSDLELMRQAAAAANEIGEDPTAIMEAARQIAGKLGSADNAMATLRTIWVRAAQDIDETGFTGADFNDPNTVSDAQVADTLRKIHTMDSLSAFVQEAKAGLGRGNRVNQLPDADAYLQSFRAANPDGTIPPRTARAFGPLPRTRAELGDWMDLWGMTRNNPLARAKFLEGQLSAPGPWKYLRTSVANFFTAAILSAPRTFAIELASPAVMSVVRTLEKTSGAAVMGLNPLISTAERQAFRQIAASTPMAYLRTMGDIGDVWGQVKNAIADNQSVLAPRPAGGDLNYSLGPLTENLISAAGQPTDKLSSMAYSLGNLINVFPKAFSRLHGGVREMTERLSYLGETRAQAMLEAGQKGLSGNDFANYVQQRLEGATDQAGAATDQAMLRNAQRSSLTGPVGEDGSRLRQVSNFIAQLRSDVPEFRYLLPVFNVEANLLGETLRRTPLAYMPLTRNMFAEQVAELAGERGAIPQAEAHGRMLLGASFLLGGILLNRSGLMTGAGPQGGADRKVWLAEHQPYSLRVGGTWVRYDKLPILGGLLSIPATVSDTTTYHPGSQSLEDIVTSGAGALAQWFKDRSALRTAAGVLNVGSDPADTAGDFVNKFAGGTAAGFIPAALQTTLTQTTDPYLRLKNSWTDYLKSAVPGLSGSLEPVRSVLGEPVQRPYGGIPSTVSPFAMAPAVSYKDDPVTDELDRLYQTTGYAAGADPKSLSYGQFDPRQVPLEDGKSLFDHAMSARQTATIGGKTLRQSLGELFDSQGYNKAVDADSGQPRTSLGDASRGYMVKQLFNRYEGTIKSQLAASSPTALSWLTAAEAKQKDDAYLRSTPTEDLVNNPGLYKAAGINQAAYAAKLTRGSGGLLSALQTGTGQ